MQLRRTGRSLTGVISVSLLCACMGDIPNYQCEHLGQCGDAVDHQPATTCELGEAEEGDCGVCGVMTRPCTEDGSFGEWSECTDPRPGCNPCQEPTWENSIDSMMKRRCNRCHPECRDYGSLMRWVDDGSLEYYTVRNHYITGDDKVALLRWIEIGAPEADCDVSEETIP